MLQVCDLRTDILKASSLSLSAGECVAVQGPSGAGKTLLLRAIADLDPNQGAVTLDDRDRSTIAAPLWRRLVGYVPAGTRLVGGNGLRTFSRLASGVPLPAKAGVF